MKNASDNPITLYDARGNVVRILAAGESFDIEPALMLFRPGDHVTITGWPFEVPGIVVGQKEIPELGSHYLVRIPDGTEEGLACHPSRLRKA
jgi:hypothetical protein